MYKRIRDLREDNEKTQKEIAELLKVGTTQYRRWEVGEHKIPAEIIVKLAIIYNVSTDYILGLTKNPKHNWTIKNNISNSFNNNNGTFGNININ